LQRSRQCARTVARLLAGMPQSRLLVHGAPPATAGSKPSAVATTENTRDTANARITQTHTNLNGCETADATAIYHKRCQAFVSCGRFALAGVGGHARPVLLCVCGDWLRIGTVSIILPNAVLRTRGTLLRFGRLLGFASCCRLACRFPVRLHVVSLLSNSCTVCMCAGCISCEQCDLTAQMWSRGQNISSPNCVNLTQSITFTAASCTNPCITAYWRTIAALQSSGCSTLEASYMNVALAVLPVVCGNGGGGETCADRYTRVGPIWTCDPIDQLGCCWTNVLNYVSTAFGSDVRARIENGASSHQNNCKPDGDACGIIKPNGASHARSPPVALGLLAVAVTLLLVYTSQHSM
jgi:hypothetical protein